MKLLKLSIENIASIAGAVIDFDAEPLVSAPVFLISGDTGAGKSTILDCICLALYAKVPRMEFTDMKSYNPYKDTNVSAAKYNVPVPKSNSSAVKSGQLKFADIKQLVTTGAGHGSVTLEFTGNDNNPYCITWSCKISKSGRYQQPVRTLSGPDNFFLSKAAEINEAVVKLVGLDFAQFCRTTLLAQGEFTQFLKSSVNDKAAILEKLTGKTIYSELSRRIFATAEAGRKNVETMQGSVDALRDALAGMASVEDVDATTAAVANEIAVVTEKIAVVDAVVRWRESVVAADAEVKAKSEALGAVVGLTEVPGYVAMCRRLDLFDATDAPRTLLKSLDTWRESLAVNARMFDAARDKFVSLLATMHQARHRADSPEYSNAAENLSAARRAVEIASQALSDAGEDAVVNMAKSLSAAGSKLQALTACVADIAAKQKERDGNMMRQKALSVQLEELNAATPALDLALCKARADAAAADMAYEMMKDSCSAMARTMRHNLRPGCRCPVCDSVVSEVVDDLDSVFKKRVDELRAAQSAARKVLESAERARADHAAALSSMPQRISDIRDVMARNDDELARRMDSRDNYIAELAQLLDVEDVPACDGAAGVFARRLAVLQAANDRDMANIRALRLALANAQNALEPAVKADAMARELNDVIRNVTSSVDALLAIQPQWADVVFTADTPVLKNAGTAAAKLEGTVRQLSSARADIRSAIADGDKALKNFLDGHPEVSQKALVALNSLSPAVIAADRKTRKSLEDRVTAAGTALAVARDNRDKLAGGEPPQSDEYVSLSTEQLKSLVADMRQSVTENNRRMGRLQTERDNLKKTMAQLAELEKKLAAAREDYLPWVELNDMLGSASGDKFRTVAQSFVLQALLDSANKYLERLSGRYALRGVPGTYAINICDTMGGGGIRSVSTASGGESFQISLALALALSDISPRLAVDTLFIDEGFGTLSDVPKQKVIETLRNLHRSTGRRVGIITHIAEFKAVIPTQIILTKDPRTALTTLKIKS